MSFPDKKYSDANGYVDAYFSEISKAAASVDRAKVEDAASILMKAYSDGGIGTAL